MASRAAGRKGEWRADLDRALPKGKAYEGIGSQDSFPT
jgi:hypothetical protein